MAAGRHHIKLRFQEVAAFLSVLTLSPLSLPVACPTTPITRNTSTAYASLQKLNLGSRRACCMSTSRTSVQNGYEPLHSLRIRISRDSSNYLVPSG
ncbi:hypothetical protein B0H11DRAFT_561677 [Mycena galericulata]|nr:hypothetical protein B0H11DRAFT_561677 [Mycena galericulata]